MNGVYSMSFSVSGGGSLFNNKQVFSVSGNFIIPNDVFTVFISCIGGGGGGSSGAATVTSSQAKGGGGGGGSDTIGQQVNVTPGETINMIIGAGGVGGAVTSNGDPINSGASGGDSYSTINSAQEAIILSQGGGGGTLDVGGLTTISQGVLGVNSFSVLAGAGGIGGGNDSTNGAVGNTVRYISLIGAIESALIASSPTAGGTNATFGGGGGGGGNGYFGLGGNGGNGAASSGVNGNAGSDSASLGGGGGGGGGTDVTNPAVFSGKGGDGGNGQIEIWY